MRIFGTIIGGALLSTVLVFLLAANGLMPINDRQMQSYLMQHPDLVMAMANRAQELDDAKDLARQQNAINKAGPALFDAKYAFVTGPANAKKTVVEFFDYDCPYCRASLPALHKYYQAHKADTRFAFIELPIASLHGPGAVAAALASLAARRQSAHWMDFHFLMMGEEGAITPDMIFADATKAGLDVNRLKADMKDPALQKMLEDSLAFAKTLGVAATPTFVLNGSLHSGAVDDQTLADALKG